MYAIKGGWVGQTFALATCNEAGGRKARIRRSKEERKAMVESFIKKYQSVNDGKFPSLNLTHKEVGGSFYTVREIVRDIIQENRVLGPAKFEGNTRGFPVESASMESKDYLFQLAIENPAVLDQQTSSNMELNVHGNEQCAKHEVLDAELFVGRDATKESEKLLCADLSLTEGFADNKEPGLVGASSDQHRNMSTELNLHDNGQLDKHDDLGVERFVNGSEVGELDKVVHAESSVNGNFKVNNESGLGISTDYWQETGKLELKFSDNEQRNKREDLDVGKFIKGIQIEESEPSLSDKHEENRKSGLIEPRTADFANPTEDIVVETFPLKSVTKTLHMGLNNSRSLNRELEKFESKGVESGDDNGINGIENLGRANAPANASESVVQKAVDAPEVPSFNGEPAIVHETVATDANNSLKVENLSKSEESNEICTQDHDKPIIISRNELVSLDTIGESQEIKGFKAGDFENTICTSNLNGAKVNSGIMELTDKPVMLASKTEALKEDKPTLDRINLQSWEGASKNSSEQETNPLLAFVKAFVSAFVKFFSE